MPTAFLVPPVSVACLSSTSLTSALSHSSRAGVPNIRRTSRQAHFLRGITMRTGDSSSENKEEDHDDIPDLTVYKTNGARRRHTGDTLPFHISITSPPPQYLGRFHLDPKTHNGDIVEHQGRQFVVNRVRMRYKYMQGRYQMTGKAIEVKSLARKSIESFLERSLKGG